MIDRRVGGALVHSRNNCSLFRVGARGNRELLVVHADGSWSPLLPVDNGSTTDQGYVFFDGSEYVYYVRSDNGADRYRLLKVSGTAQDRKVDVILERPDAEIEEFTISADGSTAAVLWNQEGWCDLEILDLTRSTPVVVDRPELPSLIASAPTLTADGHLLAITVEAPEFPPSVVLYDVAGRSWVGDGFTVTAAAVGEVVGDDNVEDIAHQPLDQRGKPVLSAWGKTTIIPELHHFIARDGMELSGWLYRAVANETDTAAPTVVYFHGGPEGQSRPGYNNVLRKLAAAGYAVFLPNVRGSAGNGRRYSQADDRYGRFAAIDDAEDSLDYLINQGITQSGNAIIAGRSYGGYLVHASLTRHAGRWRGGIAACGMSDLQTFYRDTDPWVGSAAEPKYGNPGLDRHLLREASPLHQLTQVDVPVLFIHGALDSNVPISEAYQAMGVLASQGVEVEMLRFADEGHEFERLPNRLEMSLRVLDFCERTFHD